jgi:hypothetical protein
MSTTADSLINALPSAELLEKVDAALATYPKTELITLIRKTIKDALALHHKVLTKVIADLEKARKSGAVEDTSKYNVGTLDGNVRTDMKALVGFLNKSKELKAKVATINATHSGTESVAQALFELANPLKDEVIKPLSTRLGKDLAALKVAKDRVSQGGHAAFEPALSKQIQHIWAVLDNAFDALGMVLRLAGITFDPVYALYPTYRGPLRVHVTLADPNAKQPAKKKAAKGKGAATPKPAKAGAKKPAKAAAPPSTDTSALVVDSEA